MTPCPWPTQLDKQRCQVIWEAAIPEERQTLTRLKGKGVARQLRIAEALLKSKSAKLSHDAFERRSIHDLSEQVSACEEVQRCCGMAEILYDERCTTAELSLEFCSRDDSFHLLMERSASNLETQIAVIDSMADGSPQIEDIDGYQLDKSATCWEALAFKVYTLLVTALLMRCTEDSEMPKKLLTSMSLPTKAKLRSWPSKGQIELLRTCWAKSSTYERTLLTTITGNKLWWLHNCDYVISSREIKGQLTFASSFKGMNEAFKKASESSPSIDDEMDKNDTSPKRISKLSAAMEKVAGSTPYGHEETFSEVLHISKKRLDECRANVGLEHFLGLEDNDEERMFFTKAFTSDPKALDFLLKTAVPQHSIKIELMKVIGEVACPFKLASASYKLIVEKTLSPNPTWEGVATLVCTVVLDAILTRCETRIHLESYLSQKMLASVEKEAAKVRQQRQAKTSRKKATRAKKLAMQSQAQSTEEAEIEEDGPVDIDEVSTTASHDASNSYSPSSSHASETRYWPPLSKMPSEAPNWYIRNTFIEIEEQQEDVKILYRSISSPAIMKYAVA